MADSFESALIISRKLSQGKIYLTVMVAALAEAFYPIDEKLKSKTKKYLDENILSLLK